MIQVLENPITSNYLQFKDIVLSPSFPWLYSFSTKMPFYSHVFLDRPENVKFSNPQSELLGLNLKVLDEEKIDADKKVVAELINKHFPDWRRVLNECQRYSVSGKIDSGILAAFSDVSVNDLLKNLKSKNFSEVRKWCVDNLDNDSGVLMRRLYDSMYEVLVPSTIPAAVLIIAKYQYQIAFVADQEINLLACLTEIMVECEFK